MGKILTKRNGITALICLGCIWAANNVSFVENLTKKR